MGVAQEVRPYLPHSFLSSVSFLSPLGPTAANADPILNHRVQAGALHIIYLHVLHVLVSVTHMSELVDCENDCGRTLLSEQSGLTGTVRQVGGRWSSHPSPSVNGRQTPLSASSPHRDKHRILHELQSACEHACAVTSSSKHSG